MPLSRAALGLPPTAYSLRPRAVKRSTTHIAAARASQISVEKGMPNRRPVPRARIKGAALPVGEPWV